MSTRYPLRNRHDRRGLLFRDADNVRPLREDNITLQGIGSPQRGDEIPDILSPLLEEAAALQADQSPRRETNDVLPLLEENARLRKLAVKLSNILGDLPRQTWERCTRAGRRTP
jgi:hypothetical protein